MPRAKKSTRRPTKGPGVLCPQCFGATRVANTRRDRQRAGALMRRRDCLGCGLRFTTTELVVDEGFDTSSSQLRYAHEVAQRYLTLGTAGRATVRHLLASLEEAAVRGAKAEAQAFARETTSPGLQTSAETP